MITSILDTDLYKFSTSYAYMKLFPDAEGTFDFIDRAKKPRTNEFLRKYSKFLYSLGDLALTINEKEWCIENIPYIPQCYWEWLSSFRFDASKILVYLDKENVLHVRVTDKLYKATLWEIPCLYGVTEIENQDKEIDWNYVDKSLSYKINLANDNDIKFSEFGTRRRFSFEVQDYVIYSIQQYSDTCVGTSNVYFAKEYGLKPIGTHPHEWFMFHGSIYGYRQANYIALENWVKVYDGDLGIALTDTFGSDAFFNQMSLKQAKLFDGLRQDSGNEEDFIFRATDFYFKKGIDPTTKTLVFSNALDFDKALKIKNECRIPCSFGIGTNLTNDVGYEPENIVMKLYECRINSSKPFTGCCKISDDKGKESGHPFEIQVAKNDLSI